MRVDTQLAHAARRDRGVSHCILLSVWQYFDTAFACLQAGEHVAAVNENLKKYPAAIDNFISVWLVVKVVDPKYVYSWRQEAEQKSKAKGKSGMTDEQVRDFVDRYMPAYQHYLPGLYAHGPTTKQPGKLLTVHIDKSRQLTKEQPAQYEDEEEHTSKKLRSDADI